MTCVKNVEIVKTFKFFTVCVGNYMFIVENYVEIVENFLVEIKPFNRQEILCSNVFDNILYSFPHTCVCFNFPSSFF